MTTAAQTGGGPVVPDRFDESWFYDPAPNGVRVAEITDPESLEPWLWAAHGHVTAEEFIAAFMHTASLWYSNTTPPSAAAVRQTWAVMVPAWPGAPDDEWVFRSDVTWATPGAIPVTVASCPPAEPTPPPRR